jgi:Na+/melibiose symporter-like transporter
MHWDEAKLAWFRQIRLFAIAFLIVAPLIYLVVAYLVPMPRQEGGQVDMMLYILLIVAVFHPSVVNLIERFQVSSYRKSTQSAMTPENLFMTLSIIKFAFVESIYIFGLVVYFVSGSMTAMLYFYPIGIAWTIFYWPKQSGYENFVQRTDSNVPYTG